MSSFYFRPTDNYIEKRYCFVTWTFDKIGPPITLDVIWEGGGGGVGFENANTYTRKFIGIDLLYVHPSTHNKWMKIPSNYDCNARA